MSIKGEYICHFRSCAAVQAHMGYLVKENARRCCLVEEGGASQKLGQQSDWRGAGSKLDDTYSETKSYLISFTDI